MVSLRFWLNVYLYVCLSFSLYLISCLKVYLTLYRGLYSMFKILLLPLPITLRALTRIHIYYCYLYLHLYFYYSISVYTRASAISTSLISPQFPLLSLSTLYIYFSLNPYVYLCRIYSKYFLILSERAEESHLSVCHLFHSKKTALTDTCQQPVGLLAVNSVIWLDRSA